MGRIPTLDGWRGIAILLVLVTHFQIYFLRQKITLTPGLLGVQIFFVLSGYLITFQLLSEEKINLRAFYVRRAFRIFPAAFSYLSVLVLLTLLTPHKFCGADIWACLLLFRNYLPESDGNAFTGHYWSLSLEEQFYLFWPSILALLGKRRSAIVATVLVLTIAIFRFFNWSYYSAYSVHLRFQHTEVRADSLLVGCLLAIALSHAPVRTWAKRWAPWAFWLAMPLFLFDAFHFPMLMPLHESLAIAILIGATSLRPDMFISRALEFEHLKTTGMLSYSIYIWQGLFFRPFWGALFPGLLGGSFLLSYVFVEQPMRRLGRKLAARLTAARSEKNQIPA